jgi:hypothetical protein
MRCRLALALVLPLLLTGCLLHRGGGPSPVKCPPPPAAVNAQDAPLVGHVSVNGQSSSLMRGPYTIVLDDHVVAVVHDADRRPAANVLRKIDPETIESVEMVRSDHGDVMRIRRCYAAATN